MANVNKRKRHWALRLAAGLIAVSVIAGLTGCNLAELNQKALVSMIGLDYTKNGQVRVTLGLISTRKMESKDDRAVMIYTSEGETIFDAIRKLVMEVGNQPLWPYVRIVVLGPSISKKDVTPVLDFFSRNNEVQPNPYIVLSQDPAEDIVNLKTDMSNLPALIIEQQIDNQTLLGFAPKVPSYQFGEMMFTEEKVGYAPIIKKVKRNNEYIPKVQGMAVLKKGIWKGDLNEKETRGVLWVKKQVGGGILVSEFESASFSNVKIALEIIEKNKATIEPSLVNGELSVRIRIDTALSIGEVMGSVRLTDENTTELNRLAEQLIKNEIESSLKKTQKTWKTDVYGINEAVHRKYPAYWKNNRKNWDNIFYDLPIDIEVTTEITKMGLFR